MNGGMRGTEYAFPATILTVRQGLGIPQVVDGCCHHHFRMDGVRSWRVRPTANGCCVEGKMCFDSLLSLLLSKVIVS